MGSSPALTGISGLRQSAETLAALATPADVYVINRDNVAWLVDYFKNAWPFDMVVLDESSSFKNSQSKRFKALRAVRNRINRLVELTGTPSSNGLMDLWAQIYLLDGGARLYEVPAEVMSGIMDAWQTAYPMQVYAPQEASAADSGNACILLLP